MVQKKTFAPPPDPVIPSLRVSPQEARAKVAERIAAGEDMLKEWHLPGRPLADDMYQSERRAWDDHNETVLISIFDGRYFLDQYKKPGISGGLIDSYNDPTAMLRACSSTVVDKLNRLRSITTQIDLCKAPPTAEMTETKAQGAPERVRHICQRFSAISRQLQKRHAQRAPFEIRDEYDVQDLMHALLRLDFDDIRPDGLPGEA